MNTMDYKSPVRRVGTNFAMVCIMIVETDHRARLWEDDDELKMAHNMAT